MREVIQSILFKRFLLSLGLVGSVLGCGAEPTPAAPAECSEQSPNELFSRRIEPLFSQDRPRSCNQCHLSGIDLQSFVRDTPCETMACLTERGLVDLESPQDSLILQWISRAHPDSKLITDKVIQEEYDGFLSWIEYSASCGEARCGGVSCGQPKDAPFCETALEAGQYAADRDPGGCTDHVLEQLFRDTIYATRGRCFPCHFTGEKDADPAAPRWIEQEGTCNQASLATMRNVIAGGYVNVKKPGHSLLLLKPLGPDNGGVEHGGGDKFHAGDPGYENFRYWLERYAACERK